MRIRTILALLTGLCIAAGSISAQLKGDAKEISPLIPTLDSAPSVISNPSDGGSTGTGGSTPPPITGHTTIYVHGLKIFKNLMSCQDKTTCYDGWNAQKYTDNQYTRVRHVGYFPQINPTLSTSNSASTRLLSMLNKYCRKDASQSCDLICGSMGCYTISYVLATYNNGNIYNATKVTALASAEGGSEIANVGKGIVVTIAGFLTNILGGAITASLWDLTAFGALTTGYARSRWDHNRNNGTLFYHKAGNKSLFGLNWIWKGSHDQMVSFHSGCGMRTMRDYTKCGTQSETTSEWKWVYVYEKNMWGNWKWVWRYRKAYTTTTYYAFTGHYPSNQISNTGIGGAQHGYMSKTASAQIRY